MGKRRRLGDDGSITLETVIAFPIVLTLVLLTINAALWYQARSTALAAAQEGVRAGRAFHANPQIATTTALSFARTTGNGFLFSPDVNTNGSTATTLVVHVHGSAVSLVPGLHLAIDQVARGPIERFTSPIGSPGTGG
jgi:Flp pilus assembly protein TadG